jgi:hypothetical protein
MNVNRGMRGSRHASAMATASSGFNGRRLTTPSERGGSGTGKASHGRPAREPTRKEQRLTIVVPEAVWAVIVGDPVVFDCHGPSIVGAWSRRTCPSGSMGA